MSEFKVGDRVRLIYCRRYGTIVKGKEMFGTKLHYRVLFDYDETDCLIPEEDLEIVDEHGKTLLEQRIEKLEKEVFKPLTIKDGIKKSLEENLKISLKPSLLTEDERVILRNLYKNYDFIARDEDGDLHIFSKKPEKEVDEWNVCGIMNYEIFSMFNDIFQFIKWTDKEPYNIEELLKGE